MKQKARKSVGMSATKSQEKCKAVLNKNVI